MVKVHRNRLGFAVNLNDARRLSFEVEPGQNA